MSDPCSVSWCWYGNPVPDTVGAAGMVICIVLFVLAVVTLYRLLRSEP